MTSGENSRVFFVLGNTASFTNFTPLHVHNLYHIPHTRIPHIRLPHAHTNKQRLTKIVDTRPCVQTRICLIQKLWMVFPFFCDLSQSVDRRQEGQNHRHLNYPTLNYKQHSSKPERSKWQMRQHFSATERIFFSPSWAQPVVERCFCCPKWIVLWFVWPPPFSVLMSHDHEIQHFFQILSPNSKTMMGGPPSVLQCDWSLHTAKIALFARSMILQELNILNRISCFTLHGLNENVSREQTTSYSTGGFHGRTLPNCSAGDKINRVSLWIFTSWHGCWSVGWNTQLISAE